MNKLTITQRRWLLSLHLCFIAALFGVTMGLLVLSIAAVQTAKADVLKACYISMKILEILFPISALGSLFTCVLLSVLTKWGLFKFRWLLVKQILTIITIAFGIAGIKTWISKGGSLLSSDAADSIHNTAIVANSRYLLIGMIISILPLIAMIIISIFKPWGQRK
jgi:hypothetical protein